MAGRKNNTENNMPFKPEKNRKNGLKCKEEALLDPAGIKVNNNDIKSTFNTKKNQKKYSKSKMKGDLTHPNSIKITNFKISSEGNDLFINGSFLISNGKRFGLVGLENDGKTALLKHVANIPSGIDVLYCDHSIVDETLPVTKAVVKPSTRCNELLTEREKLMAEYDNGNYNEEVVNRLYELWEELLMIDPEEREATARAVEILAGLGFPITYVDETVINQPERLRKRVALARALYLEPTVLILEEPTTHLDLDAVLWLENYLQDWTKTLIVVSQDRCFLDNVCNEIIQVNQQQFCYYKGNYSSFEKVLHQQQRKSLKKEKMKLQFKANGKSRDAGVKSQVITKSQRSNGSKTSDSGEGTPLVQVLQKTEFWFLDPIDFKRNHYLPQLDLTFSYGDEKPAPISFKLGIRYKMRVAIICPFRAGNASLLKLASDEQGEVRLEDGPTIGQFSQNVINDLPSAESPLEYLSRKAVDKNSFSHKLFKQKAADQLITLGLPSRLHTAKMETLTPNEKARVVLAELCLFPHHILLLDVPEKNMDLKFIDALADAINLFKGGIVLFTNNQFLIRETESDLYVIKNKVLKEIYDFEEYRSQVLTLRDQPIRGPFKFKKRLRKVSPVRDETDSEIILNYIAENKDVDPRIKNIGEYRIIFREGTKSWTGNSPTLRVPRSSGKTKELCRRNTMFAIEEYIEMLIEMGKEVPSPP